jgi:predicted secreted protein
MVPTIDTVDYNKRMIAISNNDTTGRWPVKALILCRSHIATTESLLLRKSIFHENGNTWKSQGNK